MDSPIKVHKIELGGERISEDYIGKNLVRCDKGQTGYPFLINIGTVVPGSNDSLWLKGFSLRLMKAEEESEFKPNFVFGRKYVGHKPYSEISITRTGLYPGTELYEFYGERDIQIMREIVNRGITSLVIEEDNNI